MSKPDLLLVGKATPRMSERLAEQFTVHPLPSGADRAAFLAEMAPKIAYCCTTAGIETAVMDALPNLKIVSSFGVGYDSIDAAHAAKKGIIVTHTPNVLNDEVANTAILLWFATARKLPEGQTITVDGKLDEAAWDTTQWTPWWTSPDGKNGAAPRVRARPSSAQAGATTPTI